MLRLASFACLMLAVWITFDLSHWWALKDDYSFGYLVPVFSAYVLYDRWPRIAAQFDPSAARPPAPAHTVRWMDWLGLIGLVGSCLVFATGVLYRAYAGVSLPGSFLMTVSFSGIALSAALVFSDRRADGVPMDSRSRWAFACMLLFPALIWILSAPLMSAVERMVSVFLLNKVTAVVFGVFDMLGMVIERRANVLVLPNGEVGVEEACSGIRSLTGCLFAGSFLAAVFLDRFWKKVLMVGAALVLAFLTNLIRGLFLTSWAYAYGSDAIEGTVHDVTGYAVLGVTVVLLLCLLPVFNFKLPQPPEEAKPDEAPDSPAGKDEGGGDGAGTP
ncbi:MAG: exosortase/archaeosortase family protein [Opitutales bacterium]